MNYTTEQINIGDQVAFSSTPRQDNRALFWKVIDKSGSKLIIELRKYIWNEKYTIDVTDVRGILKNS